MAISVKTVADKVFNLLKGYGYTVDSFDKEGMQVGDPADAIRFFVESPNLLITLNVPTDEIQLSVSENTQETDTLRKQLNNLARDYLMALDFRVFGKTLKPSSEAVSIAKTKEKDMMEQNVLRKLAGEAEESVQVAESFGTMSGSVKTSYQPLDNVKIIVKHAKAVNEEVRGSRSRNISKIFIQRGEERFAFPSKNLSGARAMARHLYNGGEMHDSIGESIVKMCKDISTLKEFVRYVRSNDLVNESNQEYVTLAMENIDEIKNTFKRLSGVKTYAKAVESIADQQNIEIIKEVDLEDHFTETHFDDKVANAVDTIKFLVNRKNTFENFIMKAIEAEEFKGAKSLISESDTLEFDTPNAKLGFQVSQLSSAVKDSTLANYLDSIGSKLNAGGTLNPFEYRAVKASLLSAGNKRAVYAEHFVEEEYYQKFIESFIPEDK